MTTTLVEVVMHTNDCTYKQHQACNCAGYGPYFRMKKTHWQEFNRLMEDAFNNHGSGLFRVTLYADTATFELPQWQPHKQALGIIDVFPSK